MYGDVREINLQSHIRVAWASTNHTKMDYFDSFLIVYDKKNVMEVLKRHLHKHFN